MHLPVCLEDIWLFETDQFTIVLVIKGCPRVHVFSSRLCHHLLHIGTVYLQRTGLMMHCMCNTVPCNAFALFMGLLVCSLSCAP